jgi:hypothetical protein
MLLNRGRERVSRTFDNLRRVHVDTLVDVCRVTFVTLEKRLGTSPPHNFNLQ